MIQSTYLDMVVRMMVLDAGSNVVAVPCHGYLVLIFLMF
jgi:hypothetical protein